MDFAIESALKHEKVHRLGLPDLLELRYQAIRDATKELGDVAKIRDAFIGFQKCF